MPIVIRFVKTCENLRFHLLSCQDIIALTKGNTVTPTTKFFDEIQDSNEDHDDEEGDYLKTLVTGQDEDKDEIHFYNNNLEEKIIDYKKFIASAEIKQILPSRVVHCPQAHGVVLTSNYGTRMFTQAGK